MFRSVWPITFSSPDLETYQPASSMTKRPKRAPAASRKSAKRPPSRTAAPKPGDRTRFFRDLVISLRNGVVAITRDGRIAAINDAAYRILGLEATRRDVGRPFGDVLKEIPDVARILDGAFELSHLPNRAELRLKSSGRVIGYTLSHVKDQQGRIVGATLFFKDLTRVEQLEERERLRDRLAALGEMAAGIAHEVKNPLTGIEVMAGVLKRQLPESSEARVILNDIINEAKMANAIVLEVLEFVRPIRLQVEPASMSEVIREAITMAESQASRGGTSLSVRLPENLPAVHGDPHQLRQLFTNLLTNAFEALGGQGTVHITGSQISADEETGINGEPGSASPLIVIEVADTGPGVPPELIDKIFSPFFTTKPRGSGLGLAIVRKIVDAHDGRIDVTSTPGAGTRVRVTIPVHGTREWYS